MKARFSAQTSLEALTPMQKKAVVMYVEQLWRKKQETISNRFLLAMCLALNDIEGLGTKHLGYCIKGVQDILEAYSEDSFTPKEARNGSIDDGERDEMAIRMQRELNSRRGMHIKIVEVE